MHYRVHSILQNKTVAVQAEAEQYCDMFIIMRTGQAHNNPVVIMMITPVTTWSGHQAVITLVVTMLTSGVACTKMFQVGAHK